MLLSLGIVLYVVSAVLADNTLVVPGSVKLEPVLENLFFPLDVNWLSDGSMVAVEMNGNVHYQPIGGNDTTWFSLGAIVPNFSGLYDIEFAPDFSSSHKAYVFYTLKGPDNDGSTLSSCAARDVNKVWQISVVAEISLMVGAAPTVVRNLTTVAYPPAPGEGPGVGGDMLLYGDALFATTGWDECSMDGDVFDPRSTSHLQSKVLRIDLVSGNTDIFAKGLKEPFSIDYDTVGNLWYVSDCGNDDWEELNVLTQGADFGFPVQAGPVCTAGGSNPTACASVVLPTVTYNRHGGGSCATSLSVYRGTLFPCLEGRLIASDLSERNYVNEISGVQGFPFTGHGVISVSAAGGTPFWDNYRIKLNVTHSYGSAMFLRLFRGGDNELYVSSTEDFNGANGRISKIVPTGDDTNVCPGGSQASSGSVITQLLQIARMIGERAANTMDTTMIHSQRQALLTRCQTSGLNKKQSIHCSEAVNNILHQASKAVRKAIRHQESSWSSSSSSST